MKYLLILAVAIAALAVSEPVRAQTAAPAAAPTGTDMTAAPKAPHQGSVTRAHHRRHAVQSARHPSTKSSANQLNQEELSRFQSNNPSSMNRMPAGGRATSGNTTQ